MYPSANVASMAGNVDRHERRPGRSFRWIVVVGTISLDGSWRQAPCGFATSSDPTLPPTPETFEIPLVDAPCVLLVVVWSLAPNAQGRNIAYVGELLDACLPAP